jgi:hypothetical protein
MKFTQFKLLNNGLDKSIDIPLSYNINTVGEQDALDNYINQVTNNSINENSDIEKFKFKNNDNINISFNYSGVTSYNTNYITIGFTTDEINLNKDSYKNSFYIIDLYDSFNSNIQNKITTNYFTVLGNTGFSSYVVSPINNNQLAFLYVPLNIINNITGNTATFYIRYSFFNAKLGKLHLFYNNENVNILTDEKYYYKIVININNKSFNFITTIPNLTPLEVVNNNYIDKFNRSLDILPQKVQNYPSGNTFNYLDQKYFNQ